MAWALQLTRESTPHIAQPRMLCYEFAAYSIVRVDNAATDDHGVWGFDSELVALSPIRRVRRVSIIAS